MSATTAPALSQGTKGTKRKSDPSNLPLFKSTHATTHALNSLKVAKTTLHTSPSTPAATSITSSPAASTTSDEMDTNSNAFIAAMDSAPDALTQNGAPAFSTSGDARLDYFYSALVRGASQDKVYSLMAKSWIASAESTLKLLMNARDCRKGKGEKLVSLYSLLWLRREKPMTYLLNFPLFLSMGYFKDVLQLIVLMENEEQKKKINDELTASVRTVAPALVDQVLHAYDKMSENGEWVELEVLAEFLKDDAQKFSRYEAAKPKPKAPVFANPTPAEAYHQARSGGNTKSVDETPDETEDWEMVEEEEDNATTAVSSISDEKKAPGPAEEVAEAKTGEARKKKRVPSCSLSLAAKWAPGEKHHFDQAPHRLAHRTARLMFPASKSPLAEYRRLLSRLRAHLVVVERLMAANDWSEINFSKVPAKAHQKLKKAFQKHEKERYAAYLAALKRGDKSVKIATTGLQPHELIYKYASEPNGTPPDETVEAAWKELVAKLRAKGSLRGALSVVDVSGSMTGGIGGGVRPIDPAVALGLLTAELTEPPFANRFITFDSNPTWHILKPQDSLRAKVQSTLQAPWGGSTNLLGTFDLILDLAVQHKVPPSAMPTTLFIFSDMQFNMACHPSPSRSSTHAAIFHVAKEKYKLAGYVMPSVIFWNLNGKFDNLPVKEGEEDVALLSGYSGELMTVLMEGGKIDPLTVLEKVMKPYEMVQVVEAER